MKLFSNLIALLILGVFLAGVGYYLYVNRPCAKPIYYHLGAFDPKFGISKTEFLEVAKNAANLWNAEEGHAVLAYSDAKGMPVNLVYDTRQQDANIGESIANQESELETEKAQVLALQGEYKLKQRQYIADKASGVDVPTLNAEIDTLNSLTKQIKTQIDTVNNKIDAVNSNANAFNKNAGKPFEEGEFFEQYGNSRIDLYEFKTNTQLERLIAHEFGHSLGLDHNANPQSIMYAENTADTLTLSSDDEESIQARCALTLQNLIPFQLLYVSKQ